MTIQQPSSKPVYTVPRMVLEAPRAHYPARSSGYTLRSSPLAAPAIATVSLNDDNLAEKTRRGATPSRISAVYPSPPSSLRSLSLSHPPSPSSRSASEPAQSTESSLSQGSSTTGARSTSLPRDTSRPRPRFRTSSAPSSPYPEVDHGPFVVAGANTSADTTRNWLTATAPPTFSRRHSKGVVMPVKAPKTRIRPQTAPAALRMDWGASVESVPPLLPPPLVRLPDQLRGRSVQRRQGPSDISTQMTWSASGGEAGWAKKRRRRKSLMCMSLPPGLGEVREEGEGEAEDDKNIDEWGKLPLGLTPNEVGLVGALAKLPVLKSNESKEAGQGGEGKRTKRKRPWRSFLEMLLNKKVEKEFD